MKNVLLDNAKSPKWNCCFPSVIHAQYSQRLLGSVTLLSMIHVGQDETIPELVFFIFLQLNKTGFFFLVSCSYQSSIACWLHNMAQLERVGSLRCVFCACWFSLTRKIRISCFAFTQHHRSSRRSKGVFVRRCMAM